MDLDRAFCKYTWSDPGGGTGGLDPLPAPGIARLIVFAMLKFSIRPLSWNLDPPPPPPKKFSGSAHDTYLYDVLSLVEGALFYSGIEV